MVIGRQVRTSFGGLVDLFCVEGNGDLVVVELQSGRTPREVTAQALDYSSWVKDLEFDEVVIVADRYLGGPGSLAAAFRERFETELPEQLNQGHRSLVVAGFMDSSTVRIVRYPTGLDVPINVVTVQHLQDGSGRELLAQVYLIEPEEVRPSAHRQAGERITPSKAYSVKTRLPCQSVASSKDPLVGVTNSRIGSFRCLFPHTLN